MYTFFYLLLSKNNVHLGQIVIICTSTHMTIIWSNFSVSFFLNHVIFTLYITVFLMTIQKNQRKYQERKQMKIWMLPLKGLKPIVFSPRSTFAPRAKKHWIWFFIPCFVHRLYLLKKCKAHHWLIFRKDFYPLYLTSPRSNLLKGKKRVGWFFRPCCYRLDFLWKKRAKQALTKALTTYYLRKY